MWYAELGDEQLVAPRHERPEFAYRVRSPKAIRKARRSKRENIPGSTRLRRNKHWGW